MSQYIFRILITFITCFVLYLGCDDITRNNILDPKNPLSQQPQVVAIDAFVNTNDTIPIPYNTYLLNALDQIKNSYGNKITICEYHRTIDPYEDPYHSNANEILYNKYVSGFNDGIKGVPDVFINGIMARVQGASSVENALFRLEAALQPFLIENSFFTIEPRIIRNNNELDLSATIARLGSTDASNFIVKVIITAHIDNGLHKRVVIGILESNIIDELDHGELKDINFNSFYIENEYIGNPIRAIITVASKDELTIFQSIGVDVP